MIEIEQDLLPDDEWKKIQKEIPIVCVDAIPVKVVGNTIEQVGLIFRETYYTGNKWAFIGGRVLYKETIEQALYRQIYETLGTKINFKILTNEKYAYVAQYFPDKINDYGYDPRKHAVSFTYVIVLDGEPFAQGEALKFQWFNLALLPDDKEIGFGQGTMLHDIINYSKKILLKSKTKCNV